MKTNNMQLCEVTIDGKTTYVERHTNKQGISYAPYGGGFVLTLPERAIIKEIDCLPDNKVLGYCSIDGGLMIKCVCNPLDRWNGWAKPFIFESELAKFMKPFEGDECYQVTMDGTTIVIKDLTYDDSEDDRIELVNGFYNLGLLGYVWDFSPTLNTEYLIKDNSGRGFTNTVTHADLMTWDTEEESDTIELQNWLYDNEIGDTYEYGTTTITRTK